VDIEKEVLLAADDFIKKHILPYEEDIERDGKFVPNVFKEIGNHGFIAIPFPEEFGGLNLPLTMYVKVAEKIAYSSGTLAAVMGAHSLATFAILIGGTKAQKAEYLSKMIRGDLIGSFALTEQNAGSNPADIETVAVKDGDFYVLNGTKVFTTNAGLSDVYIVMAKTDKARGARGISAFIVKKDDEGFSVGRQEHKMALPGLPNASLFLNDVRIPKERLLGRENLGFIIAMKTLDIGRITASAGANGLMKRALDESVKYSKKREQFGKPIASFEMIQSMIAEMGAKYEASRLLTLKAAEMKDSNSRLLPKFAAIAKYFSATSGADISRMAVQIFGGYGFIEDYPVARLYREAKMYEIIEGTNEIQKLIIANSFIKEIE
jgi:butyryl-CoA dehydrogenase